MGYASQLLSLWACWFVDIVTRPAAKLGCMGTGVELWQL